MAKQWNNGDLSLLTTDLKREQVEQRVCVGKAAGPLFDWLLATSPTEWIGGRPLGSPSALTGGQRKYATWTDPSFAERLFAGGKLPTRWYTTLLDVPSRRLELFYVIGDRPQVLGTLTLVVTSQGEQQAIMQCELTCLSMSEQGNALFGAELEKRMKAWPEQLGKLGLHDTDRSHEFPPGDLQPEPATVPKIHVSHQVVVAEKDLVVGPEEAFLLACPVAELKWIERWCFDLMQSQSGLNERHCVFTEGHLPMFVLTRKGRTFWTTVVFDKERRRFSAVLVMAGLQIGMFEFEAEALGDGQSSLRWDLTFSPTSPEGEALLAEPASAKRMREMLKFLEVSLLHYLRTKTCYSSPIYAKAHLLGSRLATRVHRHFSPVPRQ